MTLLDLAAAAVRAGRDAEARALVETALGAASPSERSAAHLLRAAVGPTPLRDLRLGWREIAAGRACGPVVGVAASLAARRLAGADLDPAVLQRTRVVALAHGGDAVLDPDGPVPCGGFDLRERLGAGGMGEVWRATWVEGTDTGWAVKLVLPERVGTAANVRAFEREIRAVAGLCHPHVVPIVDVGTTPPSALTGGRLPAGVPWYAMPLAAGSFAALRARLPWNELRRALVAALSALAHVHAHGLAHLDVKPENLLLLDRADPAGTLLLADFGQARRLDEEARGGTPAYMAPEQFRGRDVGPWSDLYALGALAVDLACGEPPFGHGTIAELRRAHLGADVPRIRWPIALPAGFDDWVRWLLDKDPAGRPASAAVAAATLAGLGEPVPATGRARPPRGADPTVPLGDDDWETITSELAFDAGAIEAALAFPADWRRFGGRPRSLPPSPALLGLRRPPLVGREALRDRLWERLGEVVRDGRTRLVTLEGPSGAGTSRLAEWVARTAAEAGVATPVIVVEEPDAAAAHARTARGALIVVAARTEDLDPAARTALGEVLPVPPLDPAETAALCTSLAPLRVSTRDALAAAAAGIPGHAIELLRGAAEAGELVPTDAGWTFADGWTPRPAGGRWTERVEHAAVALEGVAALGGTVALAEWAAVCARCGEPDPDVAALVDAGLVRPDGDGVALAHPALADALVARARAAGRWDAWMRAVAEVAADPARRGRALLEAGDAAAFAHLVEAIRAPDADPRLAALARRAAALAGVVEGDAAWRRLADAEGRALERRGDWAGLREHCERVVAGLARAGEPAPTGVLMRIGRAAWALRDVDDALRAFEAAAERAIAAGRPDHAVRVRIEQGRLLQAEGRAAEALAALDAALQVPGRDAADRARIELATGLALRDAGRIDDAAARFAYAADTPEVEAGTRMLALQGLGDARRWAGRFDEADEAYARAEALAAEAGTPLVLHRTNRLLVAIGRGDRASIVERMAHVRPQRGTPAADTARPIVALAALLLPSEAPWSARLDAVQRLWNAAPPAEPDLGWAAERVAALLDAAGAPPEVPARLRALAGS